MCAVQTPGGSERKIRNKSLPALKRRKIGCPLHRKHGEPGDGGFDSSCEPHAGCFLRHRPERKPGPAPDRRGGRPECGEELGAGELRREVSSFSRMHCVLVHHTQAFIFTPHTPQSPSPFLGRFKSTSQASLKRSKSLHLSLDLSLCLLPRHQGEEIILLGLHKSPVKFM